MSCPPKRSKAVVVLKGDASLGVAENAWERVDFCLYVNNILIRLLAS